MQGRGEIHAGRVVHPPINDRHRQKVPTDFIALNAQSSSTYGSAKIENGGTGPSRLCRQRLKLIAMVSR
jgi:hypothetical protein